SGARRVADFALVALIVLNGFLGIVAVLNDGFLDFKSFGTMLEVAFMEGTYEPRSQWVERLEAPSAAAESAEALADDGLRVRALSIERVAVKKRGHVWTMRGLIENTTDKAVDGVVVRGSILSPEGEVLVERDAPIGQLAANKDIRKLKRPEGAEELVPERAKKLEAGEVLPFTVLFEEVPEQVRGGRPTLHRATVVLPSQGEAPGSEDHTKDGP
ncbi:MAG: hypothetical protein AAGI01_17945, partial [Myxococcota bacterium]